MSNRGHQRERDVRKLLEKDGWWTCRAAGSLGDADIIAAREYTHSRGYQVRELRLIEVKSTAGGPYEHFGPVDRAALLGAAERAGAAAVLAWWPPRQPLQWIWPNEWPEARRAAA